MGYDVHITRRMDWWDEEGEEIGAAEFEAVVTADPELVLFRSPAGGCEPGAETVPRGEADRSEPLWWRDGRIAAKNPSDALMVKMCGLALLLGARVQGDDGEFYTAAGGELVVTEWTDRSGLSDRSERTPSAQ